MKHLDYVMQRNKLDKKWRTPIFFMLYIVFQQRTIQIFTYILVLSILAGHFFFFFFVKIHSLDVEAFSIHLPFLLIVCISLSEVENKVCIAYFEFQLIKNLLLKCSILFKKICNLLKIYYYCYWSSFKYLATDSSLKIQVKDTRSRAAYLRVKLTQ